MNNERREADEIERLRAENEHLHKAHQAVCEGGDLLCAEIKRLACERDEARAEVERPRVELDRTREQINAAVTLLAEWCDAVDNNGASWDYWDNHYKEARWGKGILRSLIDAEIAKLGGGEP